MIKPFRLHVQSLRPLETGPLAPHLASFAGLLMQQRYCRATGWKKLRLVAALSHWVVQTKLRLKDLDERRAAKFLECRWRHYVYHSGDKCTPALLLQHLRQLDVIPPPTPAPLTPIDMIERAYGHYLRHERSYTSSSVGQYLTVARRFLWHRFRDGKIRLNELGTKDVSDFILKDSSIRGRRSAQLMTSVFRSFFELPVSGRQDRYQSGGGNPRHSGWALVGTAPLSGGGRSGEVAAIL